MTPLLKHSYKKALNSKRDRTSPREQLELFNREPSSRRPAAQSTPLIPALTAKLAPASWHRSKADRYWIICNQGRSYGPLFYRSEVDYVLAHFAGRTGRIEADEFSLVAERAVNEFIKGRLAA